MEDFPKKREDLKRFFQSEVIETDKDEYTSHLESLSQQLIESLKTSNTDKWSDVDDIRIKEIERQKVFFWIRIYLSEEDYTLEKGDKLILTYKPTNEKIELIFGAYEKVGLNKNHDEQVINYSTEDDRKVLCVMIDLDRINKFSDDIPTIRTMFRNSKYYKENLFFKSDIVVTNDDGKVYDYTSIGF